MAGNAVWSMREDGEFTLNEPYASQLMEARVVATKAWTEALLNYLEPRCPYTWDELKRALLERNERPDSRMAVFEEFVLEALSGDL